MIVSEPVIRMENIIKRYYIGKPNELQILNGISLSVDQGEFVSIVGESGSGKSTLMNIIGVLDRQTEGTYFLEGKDVNKMDDSMRSAIRNKRIGFVFQNFNLLPKANALKNVMVPLLYSTEREKNQKERAMEMLKMVGMEERAFHKPNELSGGQKQRLCIARALLKNPKILILDDSTSAVDTATDAKIRKAFAEEMQKGLAKYGAKIIPAKDSDDCIEDADLIITVTPSAKPVFDGTKVKAGATISCVGTYEPHKHELDPAVLPRASKIICDSKEAALSETGDLLIPIAEGIITEEDVLGSLGDVINGKIKGRENDEEIIVYETVGVAAQDLVAAKVIYDKAVEAGKGLRWGE